MAGLSATPYHGEIARLATIGTPHYGQAISSAAPKCSSIQPVEMTYGSDFVQRLHDAWNNFEQGGTAIDGGNLLFVAGTFDKAGTGDDCQSTLVGSPPCNDGLVDVISAVAPTKGDIYNIRYVPYQHCTSGVGFGDLGCDALIGTHTPEAFITDTSHKTYLILNQWLVSNSLPAQCCGSNTIDDKPVFLSDATKSYGLVLLRFRDSNTGVMPSQIAIDVEPAASKQIAGVDGYTLVLPAPATYSITITSLDYNPANLTVVVSPSRPTVPDPIPMVHK